MQGVTNENGERSTTPSLGFWLWFYVLGRLLFDPSMFIRYIRHPVDHVYLSCFGALTLTGVAATLLMLMKKSLALVFVSLDLALRLANDCEFYIHSVRHPLHPIHNTGIHAATMFLITFVLGVVPTCLWLLYFNQSIRVRALFGQNLGSWLILPPFHNS